MGATTVTSVTAVSSFPEGGFRVAQYAIARPTASASDGGDDEKEAAAHARGRRRMPTTQCAYPAGLRPAVLTIAVQVAGSSPHDEATARRPGRARPSPVIARARR